MRRSARSRAASARVCSGSIVITSEPFSARMCATIIALSLAIGPAYSRALSSSSMVGQQMAVSFGIKLDDSLVNGAVEVIRAGEGLMSEVMPLQVAPDPFNIVQLRGVFRQPLDREPVGAPRGQRGLPYSCGSGRCRGQARRA